VGGGRGLVVGVVAVVPEIEKGSLGVLGYVVSDGAWSSGLEELMISTDLRNTTWHVSGWEMSVGELSRLGGCETYFHTIEDFAIPLMLPLLCFLAVSELHQNHVSIRS